MFNNHNKYVLSKRRGGYFFARIVHPDSTLIATTMCNVYVEKAVAAYSETFLSTDRRYNDSVLATGITQ